MSNPIAGFMYAIVTRTDDPKGLGRVRACVPGWKEPEFPYWLRPAGWPGAGGVKFGSRYPMEKGAQIAIMFEHGDPDAGAIYLPAIYGSDRKTGQVLGPAAILSDGTSEMTPEQQQERVCLWEDEAFTIYVSMHEGDKRLSLHHKPSGSNITMYGTDGDGQSVSIDIYSQTSLRLKADGLVDISGSVVQIQDRRVAVGGGEI